MFGLRHRHAVRPTVTLQLPAYTSFGAPADGATIRILHPVMDSRIRADMMAPDTLWSDSSTPERWRVRFLYGGPLGEL